MTNSYIDIFCRGEECLKGTVNKLELLFFKIFYFENKYPLLITGLRFASTDISEADRRPSVYPSFKKIKGKDGDMKGNLKTDPCKSI